MKIVVVLILFLHFTFLLKAQSAAIQVHAENKKLSEVFIDLKTAYNIQFAFDYDLLSKYKVSVNKTFPSSDDAIQYILKDVPLEFRKNDNIYLIFPKKGENSAENKPAITRISGQVLQALTFEPLPFSYILINRKYIQSDNQGNFNFLASADTSFHVQISHLGYFIYDTIVTQSLNKRYFLEPQIQKIKEVKVVRNLVEKSTLIGDRPGKIKINHQIAPVLPGYGDNSVFNLLRLMPGILAAGEQSADLLIWGSYESHSKIQFDGFTLFGLKNFNDNISVVNPFMVKDIEVYKAGYEARFGERVGGIVNITGKNGNLQKPALKFNINNTTVNSLLEIRFSKKSSLLAAYRQTYYQLYKPTTLNLLKNRADENSASNRGIDFEVTPDYTFRDANLKYTFNGDNNSRFFVSLYGGGDRFLYNLEGNNFYNILRRHEKEKNRQIGGAASFSQPWKNGSVSHLFASYSVFNRNADEKNETENTRLNVVRTNKLIESVNSVNEFSLKAEHTFPLLNGHQILAGAGFINNDVVFRRNLFNEPIINLNNSLPRLFSFLQDELPVGNFLHLKSGIRSIFVPGFKKWYLEPRFSASVDFSEHLKLNFSWGLYHQFLAKTTVVDSAYNYSYFWTNSDVENIPVLNAIHWVSGVSFNKNGVTFSTEGYYKNTNGINRFFNGSKFLERGFYHGSGRSYGLDFFLKKEYKRHMAWISYTLSKTEEHFPFFIREYYKLAPQHQTHEIKMAGIFKLKSFYLSANYVYGSGFERYNFETAEGVHLNKNYKRLDLAVVYKLRQKKMNTEIGFSILNVLNTDNIKYSNLRRATVDEINLVGIYVNAIPFTPAIFLKIEL